MNDQARLDPLHDFALAQDNALKSLRAMFLMTGRSPEEALGAAVALMITLLDNGGPGWLDRLIRAQESSAVRMAARFAAHEMETMAVPERRRAEMLLASLARQSLVAEVFDAVAANAH